MRDTARMPILHDDGRTHHATVGPINAIYRGCAMFHPCRRCPHTLHGEKDDREIRQGLECDHNYLQTMCRKRHRLKATTSPATKEPRCGQIGSGGTHQSQDRGR